MAQAKTDHRGARFAPADQVQVLLPAGVAVEALVHDQRETLRVRWLPNLGWACSCRASSRACGHVLAVRRLLVLDIGDDLADPV
jgi:hypothetical protein